MNGDVFTERFNALVNGSGKSVRALSKELGVSDTALRHLQKGRGRVASAFLLCALADRFGVTTDYLLGRTADKQIKVTSR